jgi:hypothetical protein
MRRVTFITLLLATVALAPKAAEATEVGTSRTIGFGVQLVDPTAVIGKIFLDRNDAIDFGLGFWGYGTCYDGNGNPYRCGNGRHDFSIHLDYLYEENIVDSRVRLDWHVGVGGRLIFWGYTYNNSDHGVALLGRVPIGLDLTFRRPHWLEVYLEIAPALVIIPPLDFTFDVGLGVRAYF